MAGGSATVWQAGTQQHIHFSNHTGSPIEEIQIQLFKDGEFEKFIEVGYDINNGFNDYTWDIDPDNTPAATYQIAVYDNEFHEFRWFIISL